MSEAVLPKPVPAVAAVRRKGVLWRAYGNAARHLIRLAAPAVLVFVPVNALILLGLGPAVDGSVATVDGAFTFLGTPGRGMLVWTVASVLLVVVAQLVVVSATVVIAARLLAGRPVSLPAAMSAAFRRLPAHLGLALLGLGVFATAVAAGFLLLQWTGWLVASLLLMGAIAVAAMPSLLAVAVVVLEGGGPLRAISRAYGLTRVGEAGNSRFWPCTLTLAFGVLVLPAAAQQAVQWAAPDHAIVSGVAISALAMIVPAFQSMVIARLYLSLRAFLTEDAELEEIAGNLPGDGPASRALAGPVLLAATLPGLLWGATLSVNPFGWLETSRTGVTASWQDVGADYSGPWFGDTEVSAVFAGRGGHLTLFLEGHGLAKLLTCTPDGCPRSGLRWAEPRGADEKARSAGARMHDGRIVVSTWSQKGQDTERRVRLGLMTCDATGCAPASGPIGKEVSGYVDRIVELVPDRHDGSLMIVEARELLSDDEDFHEVLTVTVCENVACARPRTKELAKLPSRTTSFLRYGLVADENPLGLPVVLRFDKYDNALTLITCELPSCAKVHQERLVQGGWTWGFDRVQGEPGAAMVVRADGRPLIAYQDAADGSIRMFDCRNLECSESDSVILSGPGRYRMPPALAVTEDGRALVAYEDTDLERIVVANCSGTQCVHTPVARAGSWLGDVLTMTLDERGRPVIGWLDVSEDEEWDVVLTTVHNLP